MYAVKPIRTLLILGAILISTCLVPRPCRADQKNDFARWEKAITALEKEDKTKPPPKNGIVFVGSSSIRLWDLKKSFPDLDVSNRGFGGSQIADSVHFADRLVVKHAPRLVVFYAGDNDIGSGKSPEKVAADFGDFVRAIHKDLPRTKIVFLSIKPSMLRWNQWSKMQKANALIETECKNDERLVFVDMSKGMLGKDGKPRKELFQADGLHLNAKGYELWTSLLRPHLK